MNGSSEPLFTGPMFPLGAGKPQESPPQMPTPAAPQRLQGKIVHIQPLHDSAAGAVHRITIELHVSGGDYGPLLHHDVEIVVRPPQ